MIDLSAPQETIWIPSAFWPGRNLRNETVLKIQIWYKLNPITTNIITTPMFWLAPDCSDTRAVVVQRCKEPIVLRRVEHVDQTVPGNGREQQQKSDYFDDIDGNWWHILRWWQRWQPRCWSQIWCSTGTFPSTLPCQRVFQAEHLEVKDVFWRLNDNDCFLFPIKSCDRSPQHRAPRSCTARPWTAARGRGCCRCDLRRRGASRSDWSGCNALRFAGRTMCPGDKGLILRHHDRDTACV